MVNNVEADFHLSNKKKSKAGMKLRFSLFERTIILVTFQKKKKKKYVFWGLVINENSRDP